MNLSDEQVVERCKAGQASAQEELYNRFGPKMLAVCVRYTLNRAEAEDVLHEAFIKVFNNIMRFEGGNVGGWIHTIVVNTAINHYHKNKKTRVVSHHEYELDQHYDENQALPNMAADDIMKLIAELPPGYAMVFNLYAIEGYNHREIAEKLNISEGTSKSQLAKARGLLKKKLSNTLHLRHEAA